MLTDSLIKLFTRDLNALKKEINSYSNEKVLWQTTEGISNSAGNLCLHLVGNLNHFIGTVLGRSGYIRQRELEFSSKYVSKADLVAQVEATILLVEEVLTTLKLAKLQENYPLEVFGKVMTTEYFLMHLSTHLSYHLGQINYHRRFFEST